MKERPIIFNGDMVRAILRGQKTQTRRPVKLPARDINFGCSLSGGEIAAELAAGDYSNSAFGQLGDRLWVRETFCQPCDKSEALYRADGTIKLIGKWTPSIHMPRTAARILLEITDVRVERLNDISEQDSMAEGLECTNFTGFGDETGMPHFPEPDVYRGTKEHDWTECPSEAFQHLWQSIYGEESWSANPWVWVVEFKQIKIEEVT